MSTNKKNREENLDEIVFAQRNKEYGAYELRKRYKKNVIKALSFSFFLLLVITITPLIMAFTGYNSNIFIPDITEYGFTEVTETETVTPPEAPPPVAKVDIEAVKFTTPIIVENSKDTVEMGSTDNLIENTENPEITEEPYVEKKNAAIDDEKSFEYSWIEEKPEFPGGEEALLKWIADNTKFPESAKEIGVSGKVCVNFIINKEGKVVNVELLNSVDEYLDKEALRVISSMPDWKPGRNNGRAVNVSYRVPIKFTLCNK
ncbi:MAG: energy transducer TonB [Bacteroidia bacterium]|nr:energy transducer TonB [Bacteroidia bacterium]